MSDLPPLPPKSLLHRVMPDDFRYGDIHGHTDTAMLAYGRACERAAYERAARLCKRRWKGGYPQEVVDDLADAIRALGEQT